MNPAYRLAPRLAARMRARHRWHPPAAAFQAAMSIGDGGAQPDLVQAQDESDDQADRDVGPQGPQNQGAYGPSPYGLSPYGPSSYGPDPANDSQAGEFGLDEAQLDARVQKILTAFARTRAATDEAHAILYPNHDMPLGIERYTMAVLSAQNGVPVLIPPNPHVGPAGVTVLGSQAPDCNFRPQRLTSNAPSPGYVLLSMAKVANVNFFVGGSIDAWQLNANAWDEELDLPTLTPANSVSFIGMSTGITITGISSAPFQFVMSASGPAETVGLPTEADLDESLFCDPLIDDTGDGIDEACRIDRSAATYATGT